MPRRPKPSTSRKLLVAAVGVATVNFVAVACSESTGNPASPFSNDAAADGPPPTSGNLVGPPPMDAGRDGDAAEEAGDAGNDGGDASDAADDADGA